MDQPDIKALQKLAYACRKAGIESFKGYGIEFTLSPGAPPPRSRRKSLKASNSVSQSDSLDPPSVPDLSEEELLMWSVVSPDSSEGTQ